MKAFASDLDRTLIYSKKMIDLYPVNAPYELVETLEGRDISYISKQTKLNLEQLAKDLHFIPVTTRTTEQYNRIQLFQDEIKPQYAVTTNGAVILKNGETVEEWSELMKTESRERLPVLEMIREVEQLPIFKHVKRMRSVAPHFFYMIVEEDLHHNLDLMVLKKWTHSLGWQLSLQGRKLYFIPDHINKWRAVSYLKQKLNLTEVYTSGDSLLDLPLLEHGDEGIAPAHGEVLVNNPSIRKTQVSGIAAANEITELVKSYSQREMIIPKVDHVR